MSMLPTLCIMGKLECKEYNYIVLGPASVQVGVRL